jgi:hypothetical protein
VTLSDLIKQIFSKTINDDLAEREARIKGDEDNQPAPNYATYTVANENSGD